MTLPFKSLCACNSFILMKHVVFRYLIFWHMQIMFSLDEMTKTPRSEKPEDVHCIVEYHTWWCVVFQHGKTKCTTNCWISYIMMCNTSISSGYHYFVIFIVDLSKYVYLLNETWVWNHLICSKNFGMKKLFESLRFDQSDENLSYDYWHKDLWNMFNKLQCLEHLNVLMCLKVNHTQLDIVRSELSLNVSIII